MKKIFIIKYSLFILIALCAFSCRPQSDELLSLGQNDDQAFADANDSYAAEFKTLWYAMNENYCIWDFEEAYGVDWDEVYATYLPKFEELDARNEDVTDDELSALYCQFLDSLHDGHMDVYVQNLSTGNYLRLFPTLNRNRRERGAQLDSDEANVTTLDVYRTAAVDANYQIKSYDATGSGLVVAEEMDTTASRVIRAATEYIALVEAAGGPSMLYDSLYTAIVEMKKEFKHIQDVLHANTEDVITNSLGVFVPQYNDICLEYALAAKQIGVTLTPIETIMETDGVMSLRFALFEGNIAYIRIGGFGLTRHLHPALITPDTTSMYYAYQMAVNRVWHHWFDTIQSLHAAGQLGGVILDVRNNNGGLVNDYQYAMGALLPSGGWHGLTMRTKNGSGRLDYGPLVPFYFRTYSEEHAAITEEPIVVLANSLSISLAENTVWGVISQPNGYFIGTRTFGALSALGVSPECYSEAYSGAFGVENVTPVYGKLPKYVCLYGDNLEIKEAHGFDPDKDIPLDVNLFQSTGRDNQLESALDYIHSK